MATRLADARQRMQPAEMRQEGGNLPAVRSFDPDFFHAMNERDDQLVAERAINGIVGKAFVYSMTIAGSRVEGISVDGAQQLAGYYGGIQHRIVSSLEKKGGTFVSTSFPAPGIPMQVSVNIVPELEDEEDFYSCVVEVKDIKTGNSFQAERRENRFEKRRDGTLYERPNYATIAQSKARRNAILTLIPGEVQEQFKGRCLAAGQAIDVSSDVFAAKLSAVGQYCAKKGIAIDRQSLAGLTLDQISGLSEAARESEQSFRSAVEALGLTQAQAANQETAPAEAPKRQAAPRQARPAAPAAAPEVPHDPTTGEVHEPQPPVQQQHTRPAAPQSAMPFDD